jgi:hypothetical protein
MQVGILIVMITFAREKIKNDAFTITSALLTILAFSWMQGPNFFHAFAGSIEFMAMLCPRGRFLLAPSSSS